MTKRKSILMILAMVLILPFVFMLAGCSGNNNSADNEPLPEGFYRITALQTTGGSVSASKQSAQEGEEITLSSTIKGDESVWKYSFL